MMLRAGGIPVMVPIMDEEDDIEAVLDTLDGFIRLEVLTSIHTDGFMRHTSSSDECSPKSSTGTLLVLSSNASHPFSVLVLACNC